MIPAAVIGFVVTLLAVVAVGAALNGGEGKGKRSSASASSSKPTAATPARPKPKPKPQPKPITWQTARSYREVLKPHTTVVGASSVLCGALREVVSSWKNQSEAFLSVLPGPNADPYSATDFISGRTWVHRSQKSAFDRAIATITRKELASVTRGATKRPSFTMAFTRDALFVCHLGADVRQVRSTLGSVDARTDSLIVLAADKPWYPKGWFEFTGGLAWRWNDSASCPDYALDGCWQMDVISRDGCPGSLYGEVTVYQGGTAVDFSNDTTGTLSPGDTARLTFISSTQGPATARLTKLDCY